MTLQPSSYKSDLPIHTPYFSTPLQYQKDPLYPYSWEQTQKSYHITYEIFHNKRFSITFLSSFDLTFTLLINASFPCFSFLYFDHHSIASTSNSKYKDFLRHLKIEWFISSTCWLYFVVFVTFICMRRLHPSVFCYLPSSLVD